MDKAIGWFDWLIVAVYLGIVVLVAAWFARRQKSTEEYFVGGRTIPGWAAGLSLFGSAISTTTFLAYPGDGFGGNWINLLPGIMLPIAIVLVAFVILPFYRNIVKMTAYEYLEKRFGYGARGYAAFIYLLFNFFRMAFILFLASKAIHAMTDWDIQAIIIVAGIATIIYTVIGGVEAVIWTDVLQSIVLLGGGVLCAGILLFTPEDGPGRVFEIAIDANKFKLADLSLDLTRPTILVMVLFGLSSYLDAYVGHQHCVQRYLTVPTTRKAQKGLWLGTIICLLTWTLFIFIGTLLYCYYNIYPDQLPADIADQQDKVFPYFVMTRLPMGVVGLILAAMIAAAMSSLDTTINTTSMVSVYDFYVYFRPQTSDYQRLVLAKVATCVWGIAGTALALSMIGVKEALDFSYHVFNVLGGGLLGIFLLAFFARRAHARGIYVGLVCGILMSTWGVLNKLGELGLPLPEFYENIKYPWHNYTLMAVSNLISFTVGYIASLILPDTSGRDPAGLTVWDMRKGRSIGIRV
ncbi:MAG: sodium:solute symporter [Planctomycetota bacterium]|nr:MAG: sodium:solute symporter [Planctomycetota bacterium]